MRAARLARTRPVGLQQDRELTVGDRVFLSGGYDHKPAWLAGGDGYLGTVERFIPGQNEAFAAVIRLDAQVTLPNAQGRIAVLELGQVGATWSTQNPRIHVELCDFEPENRSWNDRRQGIWIESHATYRNVVSEFAHQGGIMPPCTR